MQNVTVKCLSFNNLSYQVPSDVEEFDRLAKRSGAALDEANKNVLYRAVLNQARYGFLHGVEAEGDRPAIEGLDTITGIERKTKIVKPEVRDADGKITQEEVTAWDETDSNFEDRVYAVLVQQGKYPSVEAAAASFQPHMQAVLNTIPFDPSKQERQAAGPKKTPKTYIGIAEALIEMAGDVGTAIEKFNAKTGLKLSASGDAEADKALLAKAIWDDQKAKSKNIAAGYAS